MKPAFTEPTKNERKHRGRIYRASAITFTVLYALYCFALVPLAIYYSNDILYMNTALPSIFELIYNVVEVTAISAAYAVVIYCIYRFGFRASMGYLPIFALFALAKYTTNLLMTWIDGGIDLDILAEDIAGILLYTLLECIQLAVAVAVAFTVINRYKRKHEVARSAASSLREDFPDIDSGVYPFRGLLDMKNPFLRSALFGGALIACSKMLSRLSYDIFYTVNFGFPDGLGEWLGIAIYYFTDIVLGVLAYFVIVYILIRCFTAYARDTEA